MAGSMNKKQKFKIIAMFLGFIFIPVIVLPFYLLIYPTFQATSYLEKAAKTTRSEDSEADFNQKLENYDKAILILKKQYFFNFFITEAYQSRGNLYAEHFKYKEAVADFTSAIEYEQTIVFKRTDLLASLYKNRAEAYSKKGEIHHATQDLKKASSLNTNPYFQKEVSKSEAQIHTAQDDYLSELKAYLKIPADQLDAWDYMRRSQIYLALHDCQKAMKDLIQACRLFEEEGIELSPEHLNCGKKICEE